MSASAWSSTDCWRWRARSSMRSSRSFSSVFGEMLADCFGTKMPDSGQVLPAGCFFGFGAGFALAGAVFFTAALAAFLTAFAGAFLAEAAFFAGTFLAAGLAAFFTALAGTFFAAGFAAFVTDLAGAFLAGVAFFVAAFFAAVVRFAAFAGVDF